jgi:hypothetical protein
MSGTRLQVKNKPATGAQSPSISAYWATVRMRYFFGAVDGQLGGDFDFVAVAWTGWLVGRIGELRFRLQTSLDDLIG